MKLLSDLLMVLAVPLWIALGGLLVWCAASIGLIP